MASEFTLQEVFSPGGMLAGELPGYEYRPSQLELSLSVLEAIRQGHHLCAEAGTGTGKTLAYLVPAIASRRKTIISTATRNLQEQLYLKDVPFIRRHLFPGLKATTMKGRRNYLCLRKLERQTRTPSLSQEWLQSRQAVSEWALETETGDRSELEWMSDSDPLWRDLDARSENCTGQKCPHFDRCFITRMRQKALESDVIIVNHALFFAHLALEVDELGSILPDFSTLILDEAHAVEEIACTHLGKRVSSYQVEELARDLAASYPDADSMRAVRDLESRAGMLFSALPAAEGTWGLDSARGAGGAPADLREPALPAYRQLARTLSNLHDELSLRDPSYQERDMLLRRVESLALHLERFFDLEDRESVHWMRRRGRGTFLNLTPIEVASTLEERLFSQVPTAILVSATLTADGDFSYVRTRLGLGDARQLVAEGEFDYSKQSLLYIPKRFPEPASPGYLIRMVRQLEEILDLTRGHAFLLFTSYQQLNRVHDRLEGRLPYPLLRQGDRPKSQLLHEFRHTPHAVLCATSSFWQGVDVPGDALRAVLIDKLPFQVPTEPVVAARLKRLQEQGENSFLRYSVPAAVIALRQGLGRLIRSRKDRGIVGVFDSRIRTRRYGSLFLRSLPSFPVVDNIDPIRTSASEWWPEGQDRPGPATGQPLMRKADS